MDNKPKSSIHTKKVVDSSHIIRIRPTLPSISLSGNGEQLRETSDKNEEKRNFQSMLRSIPKTVEMQDNILVEGRFSYVDEGLEKWKIGKTIGKGNSYVKKALNIKNGQLSAVKQIILGSDEEIERISEIKILKKLNHPNIIKILEYYKVKNQTWIFMEYLPKNLRSFLLEYGPPPQKVFFQFAHQIANALRQLQKKNIMHKDIKCENVLIDNQGCLKLCDFGCSKDFRSTLSLQVYQKNGALKSFKGSYLWTAPECLLGKSCLASDIWSFGCLLIELATGKLPWSQTNFDNQLQAIRHIVESDEIPKIGETSSEKNKKIEQIISLCLKRDPAERVTASQLFQKSQFWN